MVIPMRKRARNPVGSYGPTLPTLAGDSSMLHDGPAPRFPYAVLLADVKLSEALESGDESAAESARERLVMGIERLQENDGERLELLGETPQHAPERAFLLNRRIVLEARLSALRGPVITERRSGALVPEAPQASEQPNPAVA
jgi:hypothetical protein